MLAHQIQYASQFISIPRDINLNLLAGFKPPLVKIINCLASRFPNIYPSRKTIEQETCTSHQHVNYYIKWLKDYGFVKIGKEGKANKYFLCVPSFEELKKKSNEFVETNIYEFSSRQLKKLKSPAKNSSPNKSNNVGLEKKFTQNQQGLNSQNEGFFSDDVGLNTAINRAFLSPQSNNISNIKSNKVEVVEENKHCILINKAHMQNLSPSEKLEPIKKSPNEHLTSTTTTDNNSINYLINMQNQILQILGNIQNDIANIKTEIADSKKQTLAYITKLGNRQNEVLNQVEQLNYQINTLSPQEELSPRDKQKTMNALQKSNLIPTDDNYIQKLEKFNLNGEQIKSLIAENNKLNEKDIFVALAGFKVKARERFNNYLSFKEQPNNWKTMTGKQRASKPILEFYSGFKNYLMSGYLDTFIKNAKNQEVERLPNGQVQFWNKEVRNFAKGKTIEEQINIIEGHHQEKHQSNESIETKEVLVSNVLEITQVAI